MADTNTTIAELQAQLESAQTTLQLMLIAQQDMVEGINFWRGKAMAIQLRLDQLEVSEEEEEEEKEDEEKEDEEEENQDFMEQ